MTIASGGTLPESIALNGDLVYVLNNGGTANISGFFLDDDRGQLYAIQGSIRELSSAAPDASQIAFDNTGEVLVVTEKKTNVIDTSSSSRMRHRLARYRSTPPGRRRSG